MDDFELAISPFPFKRGKVWWSDEGVDDFVGWFGGTGNGFGDGRPHAASAS